MEEVYRARSEPVEIEGGDGPGQERVENNESLSVIIKTGHKTKKQEY